MTDSAPHDRRFHGEPDKLRAPERLALLEVERVLAVTLEGAATERLLDIGTGTGVFAEAFSGFVPCVMGIDVNPHLLRAARALAPGIRFLGGSAEALPLRTHSFDIAFLGHVLHETDNPATVLEEARRVARTRVAVLEWPYLQEEHGPPLEHRLRPETIEAAARHAGYRRVENFKMSHMVLFLMRP